MKIKLGYKFEWLKVYFSPFKFFLPKLFFGKTKIGTPVFYPRKWVKATPERAHKAVLDYVAREESYNKMNPDYARKIRPYDEVFKEKTLHNKKNHILSNFWETSGLVPTQEEQHIIDIITEKTDIQN
mgnify:CR=1 FL=1